jgi:beta-mannosidase
MTCFRSLPLICAFALISINCVFAVDKIDLTQNWKFRRAGETDWLDAGVPGVVHLDLLRHGLIPDPYIGTNEDSVQWIEREDWMYETTFVLSKLNQNANFELVFEGLDTYASVFLNGQKILSADNMFRKWVVDVKPWLKPGVNTLMVFFRSPMLVNEPKLSGPLPYHVTAENDANKEKVSVYTRKAPFHFGWDWGPRMVSCGIWRPVYLLSWEGPRIEEAQIFQEALNDNQADLRAMLHYSGEAAEGLRWVIRNGIGGEILASGAANDHQGHAVSFFIQNPIRWWTHNLGNPYLYNFVVELADEDTVFDSRTIRMGLRTIEVIQDDDSIGRAFYFKLNGVPVFMKGANYIPGDALLPRRTAKDFDNLLESAKAVNMNMIRVWGGGIYEEDHFYDRCDEMGLLVWQDLMFACSMYPGNDPEFFESVRQEVLYNTKRLRHHPSIAIWCGNNEIEMAWNHWGWQVRYMIMPGKAAEMWKAYQSLFHELFPSIIRSEDPGRTYVSSSPQSNWGKPENFNFGTMHYWGVWHGPDYFDGYQKFVGRYMNEYGFQSFPEWTTIRTFSAEKDWSLGSEVMKKHQKSYIGNGVIEKFTNHYYKPAKDFRDFVYKSQLTQADGMRTAITSHRAKKERLHCMGTMYWQLNDTWPGPSWSGIDYYGRWKALHYALKELYADLLIVPQSDQQQMSIQIISDYLNTLRANLIVEVFTLEGKMVSSTMFDLTIPANSSGKYMVLPMKTLLKGIKPNQVFARLRLVNESGELARNLHYFVAPKVLKLMTPEINFEYNPDEKSLTISAKHLVKGLHLFTEDGTARFSDNYFDLLPGEPRILQVEGDIGSGIKLQFLE